jgi:monoamine oxidase
MARTVPVDAPWRASRAAEWNSQTLQTWLDANAETREGMALFVNYSDLWGAAPRDVSLLFALFYIAAAGNQRTPGKLDRLLQTRGGAQELRFVGGSQLIAQRIARALGQRVVLSAPVRAITRRRGGVRVQTDGVTVDAQRVIVAVPPPLAAAISYEPGLPALRAQLMQRLPMGWLAKAEAIYDRPFWRAANLSGQSVIDVGPVDSTFDNTLPGGRPAVLFGFVGGHHARVWSPQPAAVRRRTVLQNFATILADDRALRPRDYFELDWGREDWSRGSPVAYAPPGVLLDYGHVLRPPVGPIHWAGTETSTFWNGYMDGAVRSGERAANEALRLLGASAGPTR